VQERRPWPRRAATITTVTLAVPVLVVAAFVEVYVSPQLVVALRA